MELSGLLESEALWLIALLATSGVVAGLLAGAFGIGGGAIIVPVLYQALGFIDVPETVRMHVAVGSSLGIIVPTSIRSYLSHRARGTPDEDLIKRWRVWVLAGVLAGTVVAAYISGRELRAIFGVIALGIAAKMVFAKAEWRLADDMPGKFGLAGYGGFIGFASVMIGIGGGIITNTIMTLHGRGLRQAIGTASYIGIVISVPGALGFVATGWDEPGLPAFSLGYVNLAAVALYIPITLAMAPLGVRLAHAVSNRVLEIGFGVFLITVGLRFLLLL